MSRYFLDKEARFVIEDYNNVFPFSNFLPALSGLWGIPLWAFYVNRSQGLVSFGVKDKNHSILEFLAANKAYQQASAIGFRTFVKLNGDSFHEPFRLNPGYPKKERIIVSSFDLSLREENYRLGLNFSVNYYTLPNMPFAALIRVLKLRNSSGKKKRLELLDGLPKLIPFGCRDIFLKYLPRTLEAWMKSEVKKISGREVALFKLTVDPKDAASTRYIEGTNFFYSFCRKGKNNPVPLHMIIDPQKIFSEDTSYNLPLGFLGDDFSCPRKQVLCGKTPSGFSYLKDWLLPGEIVTIYTMVGAVPRSEVLKNNLKFIDVNFLEKKKEENRNVVESIKENVLCLSSSREFNEYIRCTYLDNVLRGGYPYKFNKGKVYYLFSRKHGDLERDYNKFKFLPSYFSEGEANYRDINQNRRMDLFFNPAVYDKNIIYFMNFLRMDGYNPLVVQGEKLYFQDKKTIKKILKRNVLPFDKGIIPFMEKGFYLGQIFTFLEDKKIKLRDRDKFIDCLFEEARLEPQAKFGEGFWIDHWRYNLDLIEAFLYFYPGKIKELFLDTEFMFWDDEFRIKERKHRYVLKKNKIYQLNCLEESSEKKELINRRKKFKNFLRVDHGKGPIYKTNLVDKLMFLILNRIATLDFEGLGIEMEADKPGWCDSLNGLPALFGSSLCETLELKRACIFLKEVVQKMEDSGEKEIELTKELYLFFKKMEELIKLNGADKRKGRDFFFWKASNSVKENFRKKIFWGVEGKKISIPLLRLRDFLDKSVAKLDRGIKKAKDPKTGIHFTYFMYEIKDYRKHGSYIEPKKVDLKPLPLFLEAPVHILRVNKDVSLYEKVKRSPLFDKKLKMYRLNSSLSDIPLEVGRSRVFPRGWLENESIWLHMEYKYLLELLKNGLYKKFYDNLFKCGICFLNPQKYGRSILENSSFIVSSVHLDKDLWGKGFVARLSGATSEMLNIWILMCLGMNPFLLKDKKLYVNFSPILQGNLFTRKNLAVKLKDRILTLPPACFAFKIFSSTMVIYHNRRRKNTYSKDMRIKKIEISDGKEKTVLKHSLIAPPLSYRFREGKLKEIHVYFE